jgi:hypothetical protein
MKFQPLPIYGGSYADDTKSWSAQDVLGWLPSNAEAPGTKTEGMFKTPPGLKPFAEIVAGGGSQPVRGTWNAEGKFFVVIGTTMYQLSNAGIFIPIGTIPGTGRVVFSHNQVSLGNQVLAVNGSAGYIYDTRDQTFVRITDPGYPGAFVSTFIDGYFVQISANRRFAFNSDVANGLEYNTLDRFTSEFSPDLLVSLVASNNELFLLSETSGEFFENTGAAQQPFRSKRITMDRGCAGAYTVAKADNTVFWLGNNGYFYVLNGYAPQRISTRAIEQSILGLNWKQAFAFSWEDAGHTVIYWTFPDGLTWGYDTSTGLWHRRASYGLNRWRANTMTFWNQEWYVGDFQYGRVWKMDWDYILEGDQEFISERTTAVIHDNQNRVIIPRMELLMQVGQEETIPVDFPAQPEGPTIAVPPLPDGFRGVSWPGGTFTATGGTPPYTFTQRPGTTYPDPLGPMSSSGVVAAGTPTEDGTGTVIARVTDANGLFDEVTDVFEIAIDSVWVASVSSGGFINLYSHGGTSWSVENDLNGPYKLGGGNGLLVAYKSGTGATSTDGLVWPTAAAPATGVNVLTEHGGLFVGVGVAGGCVSSPDGVTWTSQTIGNVFNYDDIVWFKTQFVAAGQFYVQGSVDAVTWATLTTNPLLNSDNVNCLATDQTTLFAGGHDGKMAKSTDAITWAPLTSPFGGTTVISAAAYGLGVWCIASATGAIQWSSNLTTWTDTTFTLGANPARMRFLAGRFVLVGASGKIAYSLDGKAWVDASIGGFTDGIIDVAGIET